jgi:hypothetical protein
MTLKSFLICSPIMTKMRCGVARARGTRFAGLVLLLAGGALLPGCGSMIASAPLIGEPANAPPPPAVRPDYPPVVRSSQPSEKPMTEAERASLEAELAAARSNAATQKREQIKTPSR